MPINACYLTLSAEPMGPHEMGRDASPRGTAYVCGRPWSGGKAQAAVRNLPLLYVIKNALLQTPPSCDVTSAALRPITALVEEEGETSSSRILEP